MFLILYKLGFQLVDKEAPLVSIARLLHIDLNQFSAGGLYS